MRRQMRSTSRVQLMPFNDTPNPGGEYKVWMQRPRVSTLDQLQRIDP